MIASFCYPYGANRNVKIFIGSDDPNTRQEFSELCGQKKVKNFSVNTSVESSASSNTGASNQPLITTGMLERLNGDTKGDAIVSVRGYEPIWTNFTPSYELKHIYFAEGKADMSKREAILFEKANYVFDISGQSISSTEDMVIDELEAKEKSIVENMVEEKKRIESLDKQWEEVRADIDENIDTVCLILQGKHARELRALRLENKSTFLYSVMEEYNTTEARKIQAIADYISKSCLPKLTEYQEKAKGGKID